MDKFLKIPNFKTCKDAFAKWMQKQYAFNVDSNPKIDEMLFQTMRNVRAEHLNSDMSVKELNDISLLKLQDVIVEMHNLQSPPQNLARDASAFGNRPTGSALVLKPPEATINRDFGNVNQAFDIELLNRKEIDSGPRLEGAPTPYEPEKPIEPQDFEKMLDLHKRSLETDIDLRSVMPQILDDPKAFYTLKTDIHQAKQNNVQSHSMQSAQQSFEHQTMLNSNMAVLQAPVARRFANKYLTFNGFDRDWVHQKLRCQFSIDMNSLSTKYRNIASISFKRLIVPNEIIEQRSLLNMPKFVHHHDQKLAYPYISLQVDEISDVCDGINQTMQKSFAQFVFESSYKCPNGRGYVILSPAQDETKEFYPQPLSALQRLSFSILKPNGTLFNNNKDDYNIFKIEYESYNTLYIKIITDKFFDKNEFYIGDSIQLSNYTMYQPASATPYHSCTQQDYASMSEFVNRPEGHEIVQLGDANENGFYRSFYVLGPCKFDQTIGKLVIHKGLVDALRHYNTAGVGNNMSNAGSILNVSLQIVVSMTMVLDVADRGLLATSTV